MTFEVRHGDCRDVMATLAADSIDAIVSDPPYGLSFMGKGWDHGVPGVEFWTEALRVAKPGAHLLAFGGTRTYHRLACAIEDAGWEVRDCLMWVYGSGFPKSMNVQQAINKAARGYPHGGPDPSSPNSGKFKGGCTDDSPNGRGFGAGAGAFMAEHGVARGDDNGPWRGWGTALKPAYEPIILARKPLAGTVAANVLTHGTGAINVDGCRVGSDGGTRKGSFPKGTSNGVYGHGINGACKIVELNAGRWPANFIHDGSEEVLAGFGARGLHNEPSGAQIDVQATQARFFYCSKASKSDRDEGLDSFPESVKQSVARGELQYGTLPYSDKIRENKPRPRRNSHPTVKPTDLMRYLCRLVTPPNGLVLDPFTGSGSTGKAALLEGFRFLGIEREAEYVEIARARCAAAQQPKDLFNA